MPSPIFALSLFGSALSSSLYAAIALSYSFLFRYAAAICRLMTLSAGAFVMIARYFAIASSNFAGVVVGVCRCEIGLQVFRADTGQAAGRRRAFFQRETQRRIGRADRLHVELA